MRIMQIQNINHHDMPIYIYCNYTSKHNNNKLVPPLSLPFVVRLFHLLDLQQPRTSTPHGTLSAAPESSDFLDTISFFRQGSPPSVLRWVTAAKRFPTDVQIPPEVWCLIGRFCRSKHLLRRWPWMSRD